MTEETVEETVEATPGAKKAHNLNHLRKDANDAFFKIEATVAVLSQHPALAKALKELVDRINEMDQILEERYNLPY